MEQKHIDIFRVISNPFYLEEMNQELKTSGKRSSDEYMKANQTSKAMEFSLKSTSTIEGEGLANELAKYKNP